MFTFKSGSKVFRVALVLSELRPGGMERVVVHLANGLVAQGIETLVVCLENAGEFAPLLDERVRFEALLSVKSMDVKAIWRLQKILRDFKPSVINVHDYTSVPYVVVSNVLSCRTQIYFTAHGELYEGFDHLKRRLRFFSKSFKILTGVSRDIVKCHEKYLNWRGPTAVIQNGVHQICVDNLSKIKIRESLGLCAQDFLFLAVGNPRTEKSFEDLIDATALLPSDTKLCVIVAGTLIDNDYCRMLQNRVLERNVSDRFKFLGFRQDTEALYSAADAFVLSSCSEGLPMVILEAMIAGLPVISTRVGGIPDAVGDNALLVDAQNPAQLADAMARIMSDTTLRTELAKKGKDHVEQKFGVERMVDDYIDWYERVRGALR